jgi:hypothetical protein
MMPITTSSSTNVKPRRVAAVRRTERPDAERMVVVVRIGGLSQKYTDADAELMR